MNRRLAIRAATTIGAGVGLAVFAACGSDRAPMVSPLAQLPPLALIPRIDELKRISAEWKQDLAEPLRKELRDYAEVALHLVPADERIARRAERALLEHEDAPLFLEPSLVNENPAIRSRAAWLLGRSGQTVAQFALLLRLKDETDAACTLWMADALHRLGNDAGLVWIDAAMGNEATAQQAGQIAVALLQDDGATLPETPTWDHLQQELRTRTSAWRRTGVSCRDGVKPPDAARTRSLLAAHLSVTQSFLLRPIDEAKFVLSRAGQHGLPTLAIALSANEPYLRSVALQILADLGRAALPLCNALLPLLGDPLTESYAMRALGELGCPEAAPHLTARLASRPTEVRACAAGALGLLGDPAIAPQLLAMMRDDTQPLDVRVQCAFALRMLGDAPDAATFLAAREQQGDYHPQELKILLDRIRAGR